MAASPPVLEARSVTKIFPGTTALDRVSLSLERGRVRALIGENGAGKSTLVNILAGVEQPTSGELWLDGVVTRFASARDALDRGIGIIHQELQLFPDLTVAENLFVGRERCTRWATLDTRAEIAATRQVLETLAHPIDPRARLGTLPLGQQQIVEIARALVRDVRVLMMDEPTSALSAAEIPVLFRVIRDLAAHGVSIVYISHRLEELLRIADAVTVLRDGQVVGDAPAKEVDVRWLVDRMTGRAVAGPGARPVQPAGQALLSVRDVRVPPRPGRNAVAGVSFDVAAGEIVGLYGLMGAGRTELFEAVLGVHADATGQIRLNDTSMDARSVSERVAAGVTMVPEDRKTSGFVATLSVEQNMTLSSLDQLSTAGFLSPARERSAAARFIDTLRIKTAGPAAAMGSLSGGNQQKVVIARAAMSRPRVLLMDEPTRGVDVGAKAEIFESMRQLAAGGLAIVFASSDLAEVRAGATRVLVMARGRLTADVAAAAATDEALASAASAMPGDDGGAHAVV
ncbi:MAG: sugar ABC transporter ATP-binding protein [Acidobacteria bacterium]|nr:sugar ABC transporter ATP-binding protein [Acidobacteriota bacterium]